VKTYSLSESAARGIEPIFKNSISNWGIEQAELYLAKLHEAFKNLTASPHLGKDIGHIRKDYFQSVYGSHNGFYQKIDEGVLIIRILHQKPQSVIHL